MTYLEAINKVLTGLREDTVANLSLKYTLQIGQLINEAKRDIEDMGPWSALRVNATGQLTVGQDDLSFTAQTTDRAYLKVDPDGQPQAFVTTSGFERRLQQISHAELFALRTLNPLASRGAPAYFSLTMGPTGITAHIWPTTDRTYDFSFVFIVPQDDLTATGDVITVGGEPVWTEALVRAMEERGEDFAGPIDRAVVRARMALDAAVMRDFGADEYTFQRV